MKIIAKSVKGQEYLYRASTAHKVSNASANIICKALNDIGYKLGAGEVWHVHEIDEYDAAYEYGLYQAFVRRNGGLKEVIGY